MALPSTGSWLSFLLLCVVVMDATIKPRDDLDAGLLEFTKVYGKVQNVFRLSDSFITKYFFLSDEACCSLWLIPNQLIHGLNTVLDSNGQRIVSMEGVSILVHDLI